MEENYMITKLLVSILLLGAIWFFIKLYKTLILDPHQVRSMMLKQGIRGPPPFFLTGNIGEIKRAISSVTTEPVLKSNLITTHDCTDSLFPFLKGWRKIYGNILTFSLGPKQVVLLNQPHLVKEITTCVSLDLGKASDLNALLGNGILTSNGAVWAHQRKIIAPALYLDKVKGMMDLIVESANAMIESWKKKIEKEGGILELKIDEDLNSFSGDVLLRACFGSNYSKGEKLFKLFEDLRKAQSNKIWTSRIPGFRHLPTKENRKARVLETEVCKLILKGVREREETNHIKKDLLQNILECAKSGDLSGPSIDEFVVNNCKHIYEAGYEATATAASWCLMLLASNQEWQEKVRDEVLEVCGSKILDADMLNKMKQLTMVIYESLRLYPPASLLAREVFKDMRFGEINVPKGVNIWISIATFHTDPEIWGPDACIFNPNRFANGIAKSCKSPHVYMPFGFGPRLCLGQNLAIFELKILLALVISIFSFTLSPKYVHSPIVQSVTKPRNGVILMLKDR